MRLLPTVYACHQFIHHQGLELNNQIEKSPRTQIRIGDRVGVPVNA
jgi:ribosomal protein S4